MRLPKKHDLDLNYYLIEDGVGFDGLVWFMVFKATYNNISVISWLSISLVKETRVPRENH